VRARVLAVAALLLRGLPADASIEVRWSGAALDIHAEQVPIREVLDALARKTGMKVVYDGEMSSQPVRFERTGCTLRAGLTDLLRGQGLAYAFVGRGDGVETLIVTRVTAAATRPGRVADAAPAPPPAAVEYYEETTVEVRTPKVTTAQPSP
jgi:hypothetical protein